MTSSIHTLTRRIEALEALHRRVVRTDLAVGKVIDHLGLTAPTDDEVDAVMDEG